VAQQLFFLLNNKEKRSQFVLDCAADENVQRYMKAMIAAFPKNAKKPTMNSLEESNWGSITFTLMAAAALGFHEAGVMLMTNSYGNDRDFYQQLTYNGSLCSSPRQTLDALKAGQGPRGSEVPMAIYDGE
jgi:hypothetical protein